VGIVADSLAEAVRQFREHLNRLLALTVTEVPLVFIERARRSRFVLGFRQGGEAQQAPLRTRFGPMGLYVGQVCESEPVEGNRHRLVTTHYRYTLTLDGHSEALFRWDYEKRYPDAYARWCRHHLQGDVPLPLGVNLNALHLPTGYTLLEDVIRFCLVDLEVAPLSRSWHEELEVSYAVFKSEFRR
jgi:hypothetical protein